MKQPETSKMQMLMINFTVFFLLLLYHPELSADGSDTSTDHRDKLKISYIGNMGVLLESNDQTVLIDGFHKKYKPAYAYPSDKTVASLIDGSYEGFTSIEVSLATHFHHDHFNPELTLAFLKKNKKAISIGSEQAEAALTKADDYDAELAGEVNAVESDGKVHTFRHQGISVKAIKCDHTYQARHRDVQNIAYLVEINGYRILHVGDTEWELSKTVFEELRLSELSVDVAILPVWMLMGKKAMLHVDQYINPKKTVASHIDPNHIDQYLEDARTNFPQVIAMTELGKTIYISN